MGYIYFMKKRNYRNSLTFITNGFRASWGNAQDLVGASKILLDSGFHAQSLSLSVLALEELGKLFCLDGLLFAKEGDLKVKNFKKSLRDHSTKLSAFELFPLFLKNIASQDPRFEVDQRFRKALEISINDLLRKGNDVLNLLNENTFHSLDALKQAGFYTHPNESTNIFLKPSQVINKDQALAIYELSWRASTTLDFLFKNDGLDKYIAKVENFRVNLSEEEHQKLTQMADEFLKKHNEADDQNISTLH